MIDLDTQLYHCETPYSAYGPVYQQAMAAAATSLASLPNEIIQQILLYIPPSSAPAIQQVSRRFNDLIQPILWRYHCRTQFRYWDRKHNIQEKFADDVAKVDWKKVFATRHSVDRATSRAIDAILSCQVGRVEKFQSIVRFGYDAKDTLLRHLNVGDDAEDVLARRYAHQRQFDRTTPVR